MLTPDNVSDIKAAPALLKRAERMRYLIGDKGYYADSLRRALCAAGATPSSRDAATANAPSATTSSDTASHLTENAFCRPKDFRRFATRYDKLAVNFLPAVAITTPIAF